MNNKKILSFISILTPLVLIACSGQTSATQSSPSTQTLPPKPAQTQTKPVPTTTEVPTCPYYGKPQHILTIENNKAKDAEPWLMTGDFNNDGLDDILLTWAIFGDAETFKFEILLNDGKGSLVQGTSSLLTGSIPEIQALPADPLLVADFNGDAYNDIFLAIAGIDTEPFPGFQNLLLLSDANGHLTDATGNLPQMKDFPHSVASGDIDNDGDIDIYVGNLWAQQMINPQLLLNDGNGVFTTANHLLPPQLALQQNGYTTSEFVDVNNDTFLDLVLGDAGDDISNEYSLPDSIVLLNDGKGRLTMLRNAIPPKPSPTWSGLDIVAADLNADGFQDIIIVYTNNYQGRYFQVLINNQDGTFRDETSLRLPQSNYEHSAYVYRLDLLDIDKDGDLDLIARPWDGLDPDPLLYSNDGDGFFSKEKLDVDLSWLYYSILDIDGDSGVDFILASPGTSTQIFLIKESGCK